MLNKKRRVPSGDSSRNEWIERENSNQSHESGFASDASQQNQSISSAKRTQETLFMACPSAKSDTSEDGNSDDCTITPEDAVVIFPDGTMRRIHAERLAKIKSDGQEVSHQEERLLHGTLTATLRRQRK